MKPVLVFDEIKGFIPFLSKFKFRPVAYEWKSRSKYSAHQGKQEVLRRASQIKRGILKVA